MPRAPNGRGVKTLSKRTKEVLEPADVRAFAERVQRELEYETHSGRLFWRETGKLASSTRRGANSTTVEIDGRQLSAGRIVWLWHYGEFPPFLLRHQNDAWSDNKIRNLGFNDKANMISGYGFCWSVCVQDRGSPHSVARFESYYEALANRDSVIAAYAALCPVRTRANGARYLANIPSPWPKVFRKGEWETRDLV